MTSTESQRGAHGIEKRKDNLEGTLRVVGPIFAHNVSNFFNDYVWSTGKRVPTGRQNRGHAKGVRSEGAKELHGKDFAERSAGKADSGEREVVFSLRKEV